MASKKTIRYWAERGFDVSPDGDVSCTQCEALVINGVPCHETGCPNMKRECAGCNAIIPARLKYCADCQ